MILFCQMHFELVEKKARQEKKLQSSAHSYNMILIVDTGFLVEN